LQAELDMLVGANTTEVIEQFGPPTEVDAESMFWAKEWTFKLTTSGGEGGVAFSVATSTKRYCRVRAFIEEGHVTRFEWRATRDAMFRDEEVDVYSTAAGISCMQFTAPREPRPWPKAEAWIGKTEAELRNAYGDTPPAVHDLDAERMLLSWSDARMSRASIGVPQDPDPNVTSTKSRLDSCVVGYVVTEGVVSAVESWGARMACPLPLRGAW
jgi:hypothetical protein